MKGMQGVGKAVYLVVIAIEWVSVLGLVVVGGALVTQSLGANRFQERHVNDFVSHWASIFRQYPNPETMSSINSSDRPDLIYKRRFPSGEWVVARNAFSGAGGEAFDAIVVYDSTFSVKYNTSHHFCGYEGLVNELNKVEGQSLRQFYINLYNIDISLIDYSQ